MMLNAMYAKNKLPQNSSKIGPDYNLGVPGLLPNCPLTWQVLDNRPGLFMDTFGTLQPQNNK